MPDPPPAATRRKALALAAALVLAATGLPYVSAELWPPPGTRFTGAFYFKPDVYNYLSYVEQAEDGAFLFLNKLHPAPHRPGLVNLEWWLAGRMSALLGGRPMLAWRLLGVPAAILLVLLAEAWLRRAGLPATHRLPALLLVSFGCGLGGVLAHLGWPSRAYNHLDLSTGLFPFMELLTNPHFVAGTVLLAAALLALSHGTGRATALGVLLVTLLGLVRPYDVAVAVLARVTAVAFTEPLRRWPARLLPLLGLAPVTAYNYWVFYRHPGFRLLAAYEYVVPVLLPLALALGPSLALALLSLRVPAAGADERRARAHLWSWVAVALAVVLARPFSYALQFLVGIGLPLLALAALGLSRWRPRVTVLATAALSSTAIAALVIVSQSPAVWYVEPWRLEAASALDAVCRPGRIALAPPDIGLYSLSRASCSPFVSHPVMPAYERRVREAQGFYESWPPRVRAAFLDTYCVSALVLPPDLGEAPAAWLGEGTSFRRAGGSESYSVYARTVPDGCRPRWP